MIKFFVVTPDGVDRKLQVWSVNPFVIPRNHQVEAALSSAVDEADLGPFERLLAVLGRPYETVESARPFTLPASPEVAAAHRTFCGT